ncbi:MAG: hypothetical protein IPQ07_21840 [Myxococcales bacterium]|nr:hypothetical protein [Myxococcales bacterium]
MAFDEAVAHAGPLVAAWDHEDNAGTRLCLFHVGDGRVTQLAETRIDGEAREDVVHRLVARGIRIGGMYAGTVYLWVIDEAGYTVWENHDVVATGTRAAKAVTQVTLFVDVADDGHRGVRVTLADGHSETLVEESDPTPRLDPSYNDDDLFTDTRWAAILGKQLSVWWLAPFVNERRNESNELPLVVARAARAMADQLDGGAGGELLISMGAVGRSADLAFLVGAARTTLDLRITFQDGQTAAVTLDRGTRAQLSAFLRRVTTPFTVVRGMNDQIERRKAGRA